MKQNLINSIREKEVQLSRLKEHIDKSEICSELYNKALIEKAMLVQQLKDLEENPLLNKVKHLFPSQKKKLICDYFRK